MVQVAEIERRGTTAAVEGHGFALRTAMHTLRGYAELITSGMIPPDADAFRTSLLAVESSIDDLVCELDRVGETTALARVAAAAGGPTLHRPCDVVARLDAAGRIADAVAAETASVAIVDPIGLQAVNELQGEGAGDLVLADIGDRLRGSGATEVFRFGSDETVAVYSGILLRDAVAAVEEALRMGQPAVSFAAGLTDASGKRGRIILREAETAMHRARAAFPGGRGHVVLRCYDGAVARTTSHRMIISRALKTALQDGQFHIAYQPQVGLQTGALTGCEALLRWDHPDLGRIPPDQFVPLAEDGGEIISIGRWVLREACRQGQAWRVRFGADFRVSLNLSPRQFEDADLVTSVAAVLDETGLPAGCLELEITEGCLLCDPQAAERITEDLAAMGVRLAIDDFGTGYSSLGRLQRLPLHTVKVDKSFVTGLNSDGAGRRSLCAAVVAMGATMGLETVAEGVETQAVHDMLRSFGCVTAQGYLYGRPMRADEFEKAARQEMHANWR